MALRVAYERTLTSVADSGGPVRYADVIPGADILQSGAWCQVEIAGAAVTYTDFSVGHKGSGAIDFDANRKVFFPGGVSAPVGTVLKSAPQQMQVTAGQPIIACWDANGSYRRSTGLASGYALHYRTSLAGSPADLTKSGFTALSGQTAAITKITVGDALEDFEAAAPPPPNTEEPASGGGSSSWRRDAIRDGQHYSSGDAVNIGDTVNGALFDATKCLHFALVNPAGSGEYLMGDELIFTPDAACVISLRAVDPMPSAELIGSRCNSRFKSDADASTSKLHKFLATSVVGNKHGVYERKAGQELRLSDYIMLYPSMNLLLAIHTPGVGGTINATWVEEPVSA